jgi:tetratricopeptide (TPR) repeat protein
VGLYFYVRNLWPEAEEFFLQAIKRRTDYSEAYKNLSQVYLKMGRSQKAVELLESAVRLNPTFADLHNALAWVYLESGRTAQARANLEQALKLNPNYGEAHLNLSLYYLQSVIHSAADFHTPAPAQAIQALSQAARQDSGLADKAQSINSWDDASRLYLILKDRHNRRDTTNLRAVCELMYARFLKDRENLKEKALESLITWLEERIERGYDYPDLRNYLGAFYAYKACLSLISARQMLQNDLSSSAAKALQKSLAEMEKSFLQTCNELKV